MVFSATESFFCINTFIWVAVSRETFYLPERTFSDLIFYIPNESTLRACLSNTNTLDEVITTFVGNTGRSFRSCFVKHRNRFRQ